MSGDERAQLKKMFEEFSEKQELAHKDFQDKLKEIKDQIGPFENKLKEIKDQIDPIAEVYGYFKGFGSISLGFLKYVVIPLSAVIGLYVAIKNNFFK